jgi:hypothetical protein
VGASSAQGEFRTILCRSRPKGHGSVSYLKFGKFFKLATCYCGPFEILERIGLVTYILSLPASMCINNVFHVSLLKRYVPNDNHVIDWNVIQVEQEGDFRV